MGRMKELLDQRLEENKWEMWETLKLVRDHPSIFTQIRVSRVLDKIEKLEEVNPDVGVY